MVHGLRVETAHTGVPGGRIKTPRSFDPARRAREMKTNRFDLAGLADAGYHVGVDGVEDLDERIISNCGYQSFHVDHPADILLCFQEIVNLHKIVVRTWTNTRTHFSGPVVEYILEKALPVFPRLLDLDVAGTVKFYDGLQKISMRYLDESGSGSYVDSPDGCSFVLPRTPPILPASVEAQYVLQYSYANEYLLGEHSAFGVCGCGYYASITGECLPCR